MRYDFVANTLEDLGAAAGAEPTLWDLLCARDLWRELRRYWETIAEETERRQAGYDAIRVLDFDLIYPAFWADEARRPTPLESRLGFPMTAAVVFQNTKSRFTIAPGALFELARHLLRLHHSYHLTKTNLERLTGDERVVRERWSGGDPDLEKGGARELSLIATECEREAIRLVDVGARLRSLVSILEHECYIPWGELTKDSASIKTGDIVTFQKIFDAIRPDLTLNNFLDALNIASFFALSRSSSSQEEEFSYFPLLASGTRIVLDLGKQPPSRRGIIRPSILEDVIHPVSTQYLSFATALEVYVEGDNDRLTALIDRGLIEAQRVLRFYHRFWMNYRRSIDMSRGGDIGRTHLTEEVLREIKLSQLESNSKFRDFCSAYTRWKTHFDDTIGRTFIDVTRTDRQLAENFVVTKTQILNHFRGGAGLLKVDFEMPKRALRASSVFNWTRAIDSINARLISPKALRMPKKDLTLGALRASGIIMEESDVVTLSEPTLRTSVKLTDVEDTLFVWERTLKCQSQLCYWVHSLNVKEIFISVKKFLSDTEADGKRQSGITLQVFGRDVYKSIRVDSTIEADELFNVVLDITPEPEYIRIDADQCTVFFDVVPYDETNELQLAIMYESPRLHHTVARLHQVTSRLALSVSIIELLLREYAREFEKKEPWIVGLSQSPEQERYGSTGLVRRDMRQG